jgi:hypothetical protein
MVHRRYKPLGALVLAFGQGNGTCPVILSESLTLRPGPIKNGWWERWDDDAPAIRFERFGLMLVKNAPGHTITHQKIWPSAVDLFT